MRVIKMAAEGKLCIILFSALCMTLLLGTTIAAQPAQARSVKYNLDIPSQSLNDALQALALASQHKLLYSSELVNGKTSPALKGQFTTEQAVKMLLSGTDLSYEVTSDGLLLIRSADPPPATISLPPRSDGSGGQSIQLAQTSLTATSGDGSENTQSRNVEGADASDSKSKDVEKPGLTEIIVTAQKKSEQLMDVPIPVTVLSADSLVENNQLRIEDYAYQVPGLTSAPSSESAQYLSIRGISTGSSIPTVGVTLDDVPVGSAIYTAIPDIDPGDLNHIEVLRGPQGTLYGVSSMGGLLKYVTTDPTTDKVSGRVEAGTSTVYNGAELGYNFRASINLPVSNDLALRISGFTREEPGYIDNPTLGERGINEDFADGARVVAAWKPTDDFSLKASAMFQDVRSNGVDDVFSGLTQDYLRDTGPGDRKFQAYGLTLTDKIGVATLTSVTGYNVISYSDSSDNTANWGGFSQSLFGAAVSGGGIFENSTTRRLSQELRLSAPLGPHFDGLLGLFYSHETTPFFQSILAINPDTGFVAGSDGYVSFPTTYTEYAMFADLTYHMTDRFDIQIGGRESEIRQTYQITYGGPLATDLLQQPSPYVTPETKSSANPFTYLLTPMFKFTPDLMAYARVASGYRAGGPNPVSPGVPSEFRPDQTKDYEVGTKGFFFGHVLSVDASVYYINWQNIQLAEYNGSVGFTANGAGAKSQGVELALELKPFTGLKIAGWVAYDKAVLTQSFPPLAVAAGASGSPGDRLPWSSPYSGYLAADQEFPVTGSVTGSLGASASYHGVRYAGVGPAPAPGNPSILPAYVETDLRAGLKYGAWTGRLYVNNLTNRQVLLNLQSYSPPAYSELRPRLIGLSIARKF